MVTSAFMIPFCANAFVRYMASPDIFCMMTDAVPSMVEDNVPFIVKTPLLGFGDIVILQPSAVSCFTVNVFLGVLVSTFLSALLLSSAM